MEDNPGSSVFQAGGINIENPLQNKEEAEELEDQIRRQEEIQNLLTVAMDEFNYDESTINSSGNASAADDQSNLMEDFKNASIDDQLKVLYEVRVREVKALSEQLNKLKTEMSQQRDQYMKKLMLFEADKDQSKMSLQQAQSLLVSKTEEISQLQSQIEKVSSVINKLQDDIEKLSDENAAVKHANSDLLEQLSMMQKGLTSNTISDRQLQELHRTELNKLCMSLETALIRLDRKEKECKSWEHKLNEKIQEKDELMIDKSTLINKLSKQLDRTQAQCQNLIETVDGLAIENAKFKKNNATDISGSLRALNEKQELLNSMQKELEKSQSVRNKHVVDFEKLQTSYSELHKNYIYCQDNCTKQKKEIQTLSSAKINLEKHVEEQNEQLIEAEKLKNQVVFLEMEKNELEKKVYDLQNILQNIDIKDTCKNAAQVSQILNYSTTSLTKEKEARGILEQELCSAYENVELLKQELKDCQEKISKKIVLEGERETLIKSLSEKAAQFEKVILERQNIAEAVDIGVNTEPFKDNNELLEVRFATELVEKEINIRQNLKREYDDRIVDLQREFEHNLKMTQKKDRNCVECSKLKSQLQQFEVLLTDQTNEVRKLKQQRQEDHNTVADLLDEWKGRFYQLEYQNQDLTLKYTQAKVHYDSLLEKMKHRDAEEAKLYALIKKETEETVRLWNKKSKEGIINFAILQVDKINEAQNRIEEFSRNTEREIEAIELQYLENKRALEQWQ